MQDRFKTRSMLISRRWELPILSGFSIEPMSGFVRGNSTLYIYVRHINDRAAATSMQATLRYETGTCKSLQLKVPSSEPKVEFVNDSVDVGDISLNLPTKIIAVLQNFEFNEVIYDVDNASLIRGCSVDSLHGKISPRGITLLEVRLLRPFGIGRVKDFTEIILANVFLF